MTDRVATQARGASTRPGVILALMCAGMFLVLLDVTAVNVALPDIGHAFGGGVAGLQWVVDGYAVAIASLLLAGGTVGDRLGHRRVVLAGFAVFGLASIGCAVAPGTATLVGARVVQGVGAAMLLPSTMAVIADAYPDRVAQARALGTWAAVSSLALPAGPLLGGLLVSASSWRLVFWINVPVVVGVGAGVWRLVSDGRERRAGPFDVGGTVAFALALASFVLAVIEAGHDGNGLIVAGAAVLAVAATVIGVAIERRAVDPMLPLDLLRTRAFFAPNTVALIMNLTFNGTLFVITLYLQDIRGLSPLLAGVTVLPLAIPLVLLAPVSGRLTAARGPRTAVAIGCLLAAPAGLLLFLIEARGAVGWVSVPLAVLGCGAGFVTTSVVAAAVRATPSERSGLATGISNTARQTGTASGVAIFGAVAGSTQDPSRFVAHLHLLGLVTTGGWLLALVLALAGIAGMPRRPS
ncbi:MAG TPA: MFS transporter [Jatrophihabitantaceae bacterium]